MNLLELQRKFNEALATKLNSQEGIRDRTMAGESMHELVEGIVKPNDRLSSVERLEIYSRSYWFRILSSLNEDFVGLRAVMGDEKLALDMVRIEWADIECFDAAEEPTLKLTEIQELGEDPGLRLQPHIQLLNLQFPVDNLLLQIREENE